LDRVAIVMRLHELVPARRRASRRRQWRRLERLARVPVQELARREIDDALLPRRGRLSTFGQNVRWHGSRVSREVS